MSNLVVAAETMDNATFKLHWIHRHRETDNFALLIVDSLAREVHKKNHELHPDRYTHRHRGQK